MTTSTHLKQIPRNGQAVPGTDQAEGLIEQRGRVAGHSNGHQRGAAGDAAGAAEGPGALAEGYLGELRACAGLGSGAPVVRYFRGAWYTWDMPVWRRVSADRFRRLITRFIAQRQVPLSEPLIDRVVLELKARTLLDCDDLDPPFRVHAEHPLRVERCPDVIAVANGLLDLTELRGKHHGPAGSDQTDPITLHPPDPRCFITRALPVAFDPGATCPQWEEMLGRMLPRRPVPPFSAEADQRRVVLAEYFFYTLLDDFRDERMLILVGRKPTGEGDGRETVLKVLTGLLGQHNVSHVPLGHLVRGTHLEALEGKLANLTVESTPPGRVDEILLRQLIMKGPAHVTRKHRGPVEVHTTAKLMVACDAPALLMPTDGQLRHRLLIMPFDHFLWEEEVDLDLADQLIAEEGPGILNWALHGGARLLHQGAFTECVACGRAKAEYGTEADPVVTFIEDACERGPEKLVYRAALYAVFRYYWRTRLGRRDPPLDRAEFGKRLRRVTEGGGEPITDKRVSLNDGRRPWVYGGIGLSGEGEALLTECEGWGRRDLSV